MPDWTFSTTISASSWSTWSSFDSTQQDYEEYQRECEEQDRIHKQILQEQAELAEDKKRYPLFFLKEGIV